MSLLDLPADRTHLRQPPLPIELVHLPDRGVTSEGHINPREGGDLGEACVYKGRVRLQFGGVFALCFARLPVEKDCNVVLLAKDSNVGFALQPYIVTPVFRRGAILAHPQLLLDQ